MVAATVDWRRHEAGTSAPEPDGWATELPEAEGGRSPRRHAQRPLARPARRDQRQHGRIYRRGLQGDPASSPLRPAATQAMVIAHSSSQITDDTTCSNGGNTLTLGPGLRLPPLGLSANECCAGGGRPAGDLHGDLGHDPTELDRGNGAEIWLRVLSSSMIHLLPPAPPHAPQMRISGPSAPTHDSTCRRATGHLGSLTAYRPEGYNVCAL
jgi:hypothetical protein